MVRVGGEECRIIAASSTSLTCNPPRLSGLQFANVMVSSEIKYQIVKEETNLVLLLLMTHYGQNIFYSTVCTLPASLPIQ